MKNKIRIIIIFLLTLTVFVSCEDMMGDFLDKAPGVDVTEDTIFSSKAQVETFVATMYRTGLHTIFAREETSLTGSQYAMTSIACDETESSQGWTTQQGWNTGDITADNIQSREDFRWPLRFKGLRYANIMLQRIDEVESLDQIYKQEIKGEALFLRALNHFEMFKRYGGAPIIDKKFELTDDFFVERSSVKDLVDFIVADCDAAIAALPNTRSSDQRGRITKGAALMLKSKTLLYAASPLFNTATPYLSMEDASHNDLICYGNYDQNRWQKAADAAKAVIDWAPNGGIHLVTDQGVDENYRYVYEKNDNPEIILENKNIGARDMWTFPWGSILPIGMGSGWHIGYSMTANFLYKYEKQDGTPMEWSDTGGNNLKQKYEEIDHRFAQTVGIPGSYFNKDFPVITNYAGGQMNKQNKGGHIILKFVPRTMTFSSWNQMPNDILFRLAEAYLNYAEALNEVQGPTTQAYEAINIIRTRSGQPDLPAGLTQEEFRERVHNERAIELFAEEHRFFDIRRWMIAEEDGVMQGDFYGFKIFQDPAAPDFRYEVYKIETRTFKRRMYLHPYLRSEVLKGYLVQNPGY